MPSTPTSRVFRVGCDLDHFQILLFDGTDEQTWRWQDTVGDLRGGVPIAGRWVPPPLYVPYLHHEGGDVFDFYGTLVLTEYAVDCLQPLLWSTELLPMELDGERVWAAHVTEIVNCLDRANSDIRPSGVIRRHAFHEHRLSEAPLFMIPESVRIYTAELAAGVPSFKARVESAGLRGFVFEEVWNSAEGGKAVRRPWQR